MHQSSKQPIQQYRRPSSYHERDVAHSDHSQSDRPSIPPTRRRQHRNSNRPLIVAVLLAVAIVGSTVWYTQFRARNSIVLPDANATTDKQLLSVRDVQPDDHIRGNPNAKLVYIVYSDFGCPFCKEYHGTMKRLIERYGKTGDVTLVYRQMPLVQLHAQANVYALASECVAAYGGNQAFWKYAELLFAAKEPTNEVSASQLIALANQSGVGTDTFTRCMSSGEFEDRVQRDFEEARAAGAEGTPYTVLITDTQRVVVNGSQPYISLAAATETILKTLGAPHLDGPAEGVSASEQFRDELEESGIPQSDTTTEEKIQIVTSSSSAAVGSSTPQ